MRDVLSALLAGTALLTLSSSLVLAQTATPATPPGDAAAAGRIATWWWVLLLAVVIAAAVWYFTRKRTTPYRGGVPIMSKTPLSPIQRVVNSVWKAVRMLEDRPAPTSKIKLHGRPVND